MTFGLKEKMVSLLRNDLHGLIKTNNIMTIDKLMERAELVQEVIDREIKLPEPKRLQYIQELKRLNERYAIKKRIELGVHILE
jgi:hypothetical protein